MGRAQIRPVKAGLITAVVGRFQDWSADNRTCLVRRPRIRQERGIYPAGTPGRQIRAWKFQDPVADQSSCGLKSALLSLAQRIR